jgi:hypothetical protein
MGNAPNWASLGLLKHVQVHGKGGSVPRKKRLMFCNEAATAGYPGVLSGAIFFSGFGLRGSTKLRAPLQGPHEL